MNEEHSFGTLKKSERKMARSDQPFRLVVTTIAGLGFGLVCPNLISAKAQGSLPGTAAQSNRELICVGRVFSFYTSGSQDDTSREIVVALRTKQGDTEFRIAKQNPSAYSSLAATALSAYISRETVSITYEASAPDQIFGIGLGPGYTEVRLCNRFTPK